MALDTWRDRGAEVLSGEALGRAVARLAHQIRERHPEPEPLALVGVRTRGVPIARRIAEQLAAMGLPRPLVGELDITSYRDDRSGDVPGADPLLPGFRVEGRSVVLVDDVLYTGRTARAALDALVDRGRPARIELAVLVDRGHREVPIRADYVGKNIPSSREEEVRVLLVETDGADGALLVRTGKGGTGDGDGR